MKNIIKKIGGLCLGLAMLSGVAVGITTTKTTEANAASQLAYTLDTSIKGTNNNYASNCDITSNNKIWNVGGNSEYLPWRIGGKSIASGANRRVYSKSAISENINKVVISFGTNSGSITVKSITFNVYSTAQLAENGGSGDKGTFSVTYAKDSSFTVNKADSTDWSNCYYSFDFNVAVSGSSNKYITLGNCEFYYESSGPTTYTVSFDANGHGTAPSSQSGIEEGGLVQEPTEPSVTGYTFNGWYKEKECTNQWNFSSDTVDTNFTLYAKWTPNQYTLSFNLNNGSGTTPSPITADYDSQIILPDETGISREGYGLLGWNTSADGTGDSYQLGGSYKMGLSTTLYAKWAEKGAAYKLVTDASDLHAGDIIAIVNSDGYALSTTQGNNNRTATSISIDSNYFMATSEVQEIVLGGNSAGWTFNVGTGYLYAAGGTSSNHLKTKSDLSASSYWSISITDSVSTIKTTDTVTTRNWVRFNPNSGNPVFSCYSSGQKDVQIYKKYTSASFAKELLDKTDTICSTSGEHIASDFSTIWGELAGSQCWSLLTPVEKSVFASSTIDPSGSITEQAAARYDQLVHKYALENFANRSVSSANNNILSIVGENNTSTWIIVAVSLAGLTAIGGYFFYKKRKENF